MSTKTPRQERDSFEVYQESVANVLNQASKLQQSYTQAVTGLQNDVFQAYRKAADSALAVQKEFANAFGVQARIPAVANATEITDGFIKTSEVNSNAVVAAIDATRQNIKTISNTLDAFAKINQNLINTWENYFTPSRA